MVNFTETPLITRCLCYYRKHYQDGAISKAQNCKKGRSFGLLKTPACCKKSKTLNGDLLETFKKNSKKKQMRTLNSLVLPKMK